VESTCVEAGVRADVDHGVAGREELRVLVREHLLVVEATYPPEQGQVPELPIRPQRCRVRGHRNIIPM
jgi:hypothetical protein